MNLNMHIICQALSDLGIKQRIASAPQTRPLRYAGLAGTDRDLPADRLNVIRAKEAADFDLEASGPASLFFDGPPPAHLLDNPVLDIAWTEVAVGTNTLMNRCNAAFAYYQDWVMDLHDLLSKNAPLRRLGERSLHVFENPIWLMDKDFYIGFSSCLRSWDLPQGYRIEREGASLPIEEIDFFNEIHRSKPRSSRYPYESSRKRGCKTLCYDILVADERVATLVIDSIRRPVSLADHSLLKILGDTISRNLSFNARFEKRPSIALSAVMEQLLKGQVSSSSKLTMALADKEWSLDDPYLVCSTRSASGSSYPESVLAPIAAKICDEMDDTVFCIDNTRLVFVSNLHDIEEDVQEIPQQLLEAMHKQGMTPEIGVSGVFDDFASLRVFKEQADDALQLGTEQGLHGIHHFEDFLEESFKKRCLRGTVPSAFAPPALLRIRRHDKQFSTDLETFLRAYVSCSYSVNDTAKEMRVHRNTITARIQKIEEVGMVDLSDRNIRLQLGVAFLVDD